jgi:hypothetical protein
VKWAACSRYRAMRARREEIEPKGLLDSWRSLLIANVPTFPRCLGAHLREGG